MKQKILEEKRRNLPTTPNDAESDHQKAVTGPLTRVTKKNQLPILEKRGGSRARVVTPPQANEADENTTQLSTYSRATKKVLLTDNGNGKQPRLPGKSLPRLVGGLRKLDKLAPGKALDPLVDGKILKNPKGLPKPPGEPAEKPPASSVFAKQFSKTLAGYSEGKTKTNQDSVYLNCRVKGSANCALFGVFDGHGMQGHKVSQMLKATLTGRRF
jgi:hypothetical protein